MPRLVEKLDGTYYVRHHYHDHSTWQIDGDGVLFLASIGVTPGKLFATDLFMVAWSLGYLYTVRSSRVPGSPKPLVGDEALHVSAQAVYRAIYSRSWGRVVETSWLVVSGQMTAMALEHKLGSEAFRSRRRLEDTKRN